MFNLIKKDIKEGISCNKYSFIILILIVLSGCIIYKVKVSSAGVVYMIDEDFLDYILYIFNGVSIFGTSQNILNNTSVFWYILQIFIGYIILKYEKSDLLNNAEHSLLSINRGSWWTSKCIWSAVAVIFCYAVCYVTIFIFCFITGTNISLRFPESVNSAIENSNIFINVGIIEKLLLIILPIVISCSIINIQRLIGVMFKPIVGFIIIHSIIIISIVLNEVYYLFDNIKFMMENGLNGVDEYFICIVSCLFCTVMGYFFFKNYDVIGK